MTDKQIEDLKAQALRLRVKMLVYGLGADYAQMALVEKHIPTLTQYLDMKSNDITDEIIKLCGGVKLPAPSKKSLLRYPICKQCDLMGKCTSANEQCPGFVDKVKK